MAPALGAGICQAEVVENPWSVERLQLLLREAVLRHGAVTDGFHGVDVVSSAVGAPPGPSGPALTVLFRWRKDSATYAVSFPLPRAPAAEGFWSGMPFPSPEDWALEITGWLMEELDTGWVRRARRVAGGEIIHLLGADSPDVAPRGYYIGEVPLGPRGGGWHLRGVGLDIAVPRRAMDEGRLITWLQAFVNNTAGEPVVGHVVISREPDTEHRSRLELLQTTAGTPPGVATALVYNALRDAIDQGAATIVANARFQPVLAELGFNLSADPDESVLPLDQLQQPSFVTP